MDTPRSHPTLSSILSTLLTTPGYSTHTRFASDRASVAVFPVTTPESLLDSQAFEEAIGVSMFAKCLLIAHPHAKTIINAVFQSKQSSHVQYNNASDPEIRPGGTDGVGTFVPRLGAHCACSETNGEHGGSEALTILLLIHSTGQIK